VIGDVSDVVGYAWTVWLEKPDACSIGDARGGSKAMLGLRLYMDEEPSSRTVSHVEGPAEPAKPELEILLHRPSSKEESTILLRLACVMRFCLSGSLALEASETCDRVRRCCDIFMSYKCNELAESFVDTLCLSEVLDLALSSCG
jgi:hypothetical protein